MSAKVKNRTLTALLRWIMNPDFSNAEIVLKNPTAASALLLDPVGYPLLFNAGTGKYEIAVQGDESDVVALLFVTEDLPAIAAGADLPTKSLAIVRGPVICSKAGIPLLDVAGDAFDVDAIIAALSAFNFVFTTEPEKTSEQLT